MDGDWRGVKALTFDVFGTVVDWRGTIIEEGEALNRRWGTSIPWQEFADAWRAGYAPAMDRVRTGVLPWTRVDDLHRMILEQLLPRFGAPPLSEEEVDRLNRVWHRLRPWPDSVGGLERLRKRYIVASLSNGNMALLVNMAKHAGLPWDCILSAEIARHYKPDPQVYLMAAELLGLHPGEVMMVAAHSQDLQAAAAAGLRTAFVERPLEHGAGGSVEVVAPPGVDLSVTDFYELADRLRV